jgi:hypothetical protein
MVWVHKSVHVSICEHVRLRLVAFLSNLPGDILSVRVRSRSGLCTFSIRNPGPLPTCLQYMPQPNSHDVWIPLPHLETTLFKNAAGSWTNIHPMRICSSSLSRPYQSKAYTHTLPKHACPCLLHLTNDNNVWNETDWWEACRIRLYTHESGGASVLHCL